MNSFTYNNIALTYDDIQLIPQYSEIETRQNVSLLTKVSNNFHITVPYVASPMDTICEANMAIKMMYLGGVGCIHRFNTIHEQCQQVIQVSRYARAQYPDNWDTIPIMAAIGSNGDYYERADALVQVGANILLIDVAHGHHKNVKEAISKLKKEFPSIDIIAGNIATKEASQDLIEWGADGLRVGIGGGSLCTTRVQTGHGIPNFTSLLEVLEVSGEVPVMADGGIRSSGDIAKALAAGADCVMLGSLLAGTQETPGAVIEKGPHLYKRYRGSASLETKSAHQQQLRNVEGESTVVPFKGGVKYVIERLNDGLRSALSYSGSSNLQHFRGRAKWVQTTNAGIAEARPHLLG